MKKTMSTAKYLYSKALGIPNDYQPIINLFGEVLLQIDEDNYQGDSWVLYEAHESYGTYGFLNFGWGSCSGCDVLQGCENLEEVDSLIEDLYQSIKWFDSASEALNWFKNHDWEGDYCGSLMEIHKFVEKAKKILKKRI